MPVWYLECALQGRWSRCILILSSSWWIKPSGSKTCGETSRSTACGRFIRQYGTLPLFWQNVPYHWYVVQFWVYFSGHLILLFSVKWLYSAVIPLCLHLFVYGLSYFVGVVLESSFEWHDAGGKYNHHHHHDYYLFFFLFWHYSPRWTLAPSTVVLHCPQSCYLHLQFLTPIFFRFSSTDSGHLNFGFAASWVSSGLSILSARIQFLHCKKVSQPPLSSCIHHFDYV